MNAASLPYAGVYLLGVFLSSCSQVLLKKAALQNYKTPLQEYLNWRLLLGYSIFVLCTLMTLIAYRGIPMSFGPILETTSYIYITIFSVTIFQEKTNKKQILALVIILAGIVLYSA